MLLFFSILNILALSLLFPSKTFAQCPVCIVTVGGGMLLAQKLGIDDLLVSIWISGLNTALSFWLAPKIKIKFLNHPHLLSLFLYLSTLAYFQFTNQIDGPQNQIFGINKIVLGLTLGLLLIFLASFLDGYLRSKNHGKVLFYYQKVILPLGLLLLSTIFLKFTLNL